MELIDTEGMEVIHAIVTAKSTGVFEDVGEFFEYSGKDKLCENNYDLEVSIPEKRGFIDVIFYKNFDDELCKGFCIISLLDAYGNQRFSRTFLLVNESDRRVSYISVSALRSDSDSDVLIPNNGITLLIDVYLLEHPKSEGSITLEYDDAFASSFEYSAFGNNRIVLDSPLAKCLQKESAFLNSSIKEEKWKTLYFDERDFKTFKHIGKILMEINPLIFNSIEEIFEMYITAGKYEISAVTATCECFLKLCLFDYTVEEYQALANTYLSLADEYEVLRNLINQVNQTDFNGEIEMYADGAVLKLPIRNCLWFYRHQRNGLLYFENIAGKFKKNVLIPKEEKDEVFDFYA